MRKRKDEEPGQKLIEESEPENFIVTTHEQYRAVKEEFLSGLITVVELGVRITPHVTECQPCHSDLEETIEELTKELERRNPSY